MILNRARRWTVFALALAIGLLAFWPLRLAPGLSKSGIAAGSARGTLWSGTLEAAQWRGIALGDLAVGVAPLSLVAGNLRMHIEGPALRGTILRGSVSGLSGATGDMAVGGVLPLPVSRLALDTVTATFANGACTEATGQVRLAPGGAIAAITGGESFAGAIRCDAGKLLLPLTAGPAQMQVRIGGDGRYNASILVGGIDEAQRQGLAAAGFQPTPDGAAINVEGSL